jgi:hypothetical protein
MQRTVSPSFRNSQTLVSTGTKAGWLEAREQTAVKGGLPSLRLLEFSLLNLVLGSKNWREQERRVLSKALYPAWSGEVLVYAARDRQLEKGADVVDGSADRPWVLPYSSIPQDAIGKKGIAILVKPQHVEVTENRVMVVADPETAMVVTSFPQRSGQFGDIDWTTGIISFNQKRGHRRLAQQPNPMAQLLRVEGPGVKPIIVGVSDGAIQLDARAWQAGEYGVGYAVPAVNTALHGEILTEKVTADELRELARRAEDSLLSIAQVAPDADLRNMYALVETIRRGKNLPVPDF